MRYVKKMYTIPKSTFYRCLKIMMDQHILKDVYEDILKTTQQSVNH
jgi:hypothetical protein